VILQLSATTEQLVLTYNSTLKGYLCSLTGVKNGTAKITLRDASTVALSTVASNAVDITVNLNAAAFNQDCS